MTIRAKVNYIVYPQKSNITLDDYLICKCTAPVESIPPEFRFGQKREITFSAKGKGIPITKKFDVQLEGSWSLNEKFGLTLDVKSADIAPPSDEAGIINYLVMFLDGCGKASAKRIYKKFGQATIMVLQDAPEKLYEVPRLKKGSVEKMIASFKRTQGIVELTTLLSPYNIGKRRIEYIYNILGPDAADIVKKNPFSMQNVHGIGYETMDALSQQFGSDPNNPLRIKAALKHCIKQASYGSNIFVDPVLKSGGNLFINQYALRDSALRLLNQRADYQTDKKQVTQIIWDMYTHNELLGENGNVYLPEVFCNERDCAKNIVKLMAQSSVKKYSGTIAVNAVKKAENSVGIELSNNQREAVMTVLSNPLTVITGGAGTGKSTVLKVILESLKILGENPSGVVLAAPTGKAATRMTECTGYHASTLHKALGLMAEEDYWLRDDEFETLQANFVVVDEFSMTDMFIAYRLFSQIDLYKTRVLLVGDVGQLPSVGAGDVLDQIIESKIVPTARLVTIFRQAQESNIVCNSVNISNGVKDITFEKDCHYIKCDNPDETLKRLLEVYCQQVQKYGVDNTIILCPIREYKNERKLCTVYINEQIQALINPPAHNKPEAKVFGKIFRVGDKVIQLKNKTFRQTIISSSNTENHEISIDVCNGDIGKIKSISKDENGYFFYVEFSDDRLIKLDEDAIKNIALAYSLTVHKSQGSEYTSVILPFPSSPHPKNERISIPYYSDNMMTRNFVYTAVTRAKKELFVVGDSRMMLRAIGNVNTLKRNTVLAEKIKQYYQEETQ